MIDTGRLAEVQDALGEATRADATAEWRRKHALQALGLLMDAVADEAAYAAFYCPGCGGFRIGLEDGLDGCEFCGRILEEKVLTETTAFRELERHNAGAIGP